MVTPFISMATEDSQRQENKKNALRGKKPCKKDVKKVPQRGMGVFKLERLRLQERWKKMTDFNQLQSLQLINTNNNTTNFSYLLNPNNGGVLPMQHGGGQSSVLISTMGFVKDVSFRRNGMVDMYGNGGCSESHVELSSMPKLGGNVCFKKKFTNEDMNGEREKIQKISPGVGVIAVHRKANSDVLMEYNFFPEKKRDIGSSSTFSKDMLGADAFGVETSPSPPTSAITACSDLNNSLSPTSVDLSLKL